MRAKLENNCLVVRGIDKECPFRKEGCRCGAWCALFLTEVKDNKNIVTLHCAPKPIVYEIHG